MLIGLALFLTIVITQPVAMDIYSNAWAPLERGEITAASSDGSRVGADEDISGKIRSGERRSAVCRDQQSLPRPGPQPIWSLSVLVPAYILSELKTGFQIGAVLFLPFLIIDLVVASVTLTIGMVQLPPVMISAPFKILLFVLVDGWNLVVGSLMKSFY